MFNRDLNPNLRAAADLAGNGKLSAEAFGPFRNPKQPEMTFAWPRRFFLLEAASIVLDLEHHILRAIIQFDAGRRRPGMFDDIRQ